MVSNVVTNTVSTKNIYSQLIASFKELTNIYEGNCEFQDVVEINNYFQAKVSQMKKKLLENLPYHNNDPDVQFVNCNVPCSKKRKTHGTR